MKSLIRYRNDASFLPLGTFERSQLSKLCKVAQSLDKNEHIPATSSNFSIRTKTGAFISRSGIHKRFLTPHDFIRVNLDGKPTAHFAPKPSDETLLHTILYQLIPNATCVLHCHPRAIEKVTAPGLQLSGHELLKILGFKDHQTPLFLDTFANDQDMAKLSRSVAKKYATGDNSTSLTFGVFVLENHGIYCAGKSIENAEARLEAIIHLLSTHQFTNL